MTAMETATKEVMIVETNEQDAQSGAKALSQVSGVTIALLTPQTHYALKKAEEKPPYLAVIDEKVQGWQDFCRQITHQSPKTKTVVTTDNPNGKLEGEARAVGAVAILPKPLIDMQEELPALFGDGEEKKRPDPEVFSWPEVHGEQGFSNPSGISTQNEPQYEPFNQLRGSMPQGNFGQQPFMGQLNREPQILQQPLRSGQGIQMGIYSQAPPRPKMIVTVYSPKGGVGKTTMSLNLAVALRKVSAMYLGDRNAFNVGLVDFDVDFGDVAASLQLVPRGSVVDWPKEDNFNPDYVKNLFTFHPPSNVAILAGPERPEMEFMLNEEQAKHVISGTHRLFDIVVVDMGYSLRKSSLLAMSMATHPLFVTTPDTPAVRDMTRAKKSLEEHNINLSKGQLIINKLPRKGKPPLSVQEVKRYIGMPVAGEVHEDPRVLDALSEGTPLTLIGKSPAAQEIEQMAENMIKDYLPSESQKQSSFLRRLFGGK